MLKSRSTRRSGRRTISRRDLGLGLVAGLVGGFYAQAQRGQRLVAETLQLLPKGNDWGTPVAGGAATSTLGQPVEQCRIAKWGERPFRRPDEPMDAQWEADCYATLRGQSIPAVHAFALVERIREGTPDEEVLISNNVIRGQVQDYSPYMATSFRGQDGKRHVCHATRAEHRSDQYQEQAAAYHSGGYVVAVPYACNNPTRIFPRPAYAAKSAQSAYPLLQGELPGIHAPGATQPGAGALAHNVPEPASLALAGLGLVALFVARRRASSRKESS